jgi:ribonuclease E
MYILNQKRARLNEIEARYNFVVKVTIDDALIPPAFKLERTKTRDLPLSGSERHTPVMAGAIVNGSDDAGEATSFAPTDDAVDDIDEPRDVDTDSLHEVVESPRADTERDDEFGRRSRRPRRRGRRTGPREDRPETVRSEGPRTDESRGEPRNEQRPRRDYPRDDAFPLTPAAVGAMLDGRPVASLDDEGDDEEQPASLVGRGPSDAHGQGDEGGLGPDGQPRRRRRRGRRGGRRRRRPNGDEAQSPQALNPGEAPQPNLVESYESIDRGNQPHEQSPGHPDAPPSAHRAEPDRSPATQTEPQPVRHEHTVPPSSNESGTSEQNPNQPPRKGWWQRLTS